MRQLLFFYFNSSLNGELFYGEHFMLTELERIVTTPRTTIRQDGGYRHPAMRMNAGVFAFILDIGLACADKLFLLGVGETAHDFTSFRRCLRDC